MNNMMEQFEKFVERENTAAELPAQVPTPEEFVDNVIYVDFKKRCIIQK